MAALSPNSEQAGSSGAVGEESSFCERREEKACQGPCCGRAAAAAAAAGVSVIRGGLLLVPLPRGFSRKLVGTIIA